jgi:hypothetical protein
MWADWPLPDSLIEGYQGSVGTDVRRQNYTLTITEPDGKVTTQHWDIIQDTTGVQSLTYVPTQVGVYTAKFDYGGQTYTWNSTTTQRTWNGDVFLPASTTTSFTVH